MPGFGDVAAWTFLSKLYAVPGIKAYFDAVALHPYGANLNKVKTGDPASSQRDEEPRRRRDAAVGRRDRLGISAPDSHGINKGLSGQATMLNGAFKMILSHRTSWNIERVFWYHWRDPRRSRAMCSFCGSAGLLRFDHSAKPADEGVQELHCGHDPAPGRPSPRDRPTEASSTTRPPPSGSPRTRSARPSSATSMPGLSRRARRRSPRSSPSPRAPTPSTSGRSTPQAT